MFKWPSQNRASGSVQHGHFRKSLIVTFFLFSILGILGVLQFFGLIWFNSLFVMDYAIKGLDISHHQGQIDWPKVAATKKYAFVYIKATEGNDFTDDDFLTNWQGAKNNGLAVGAYHFFSMRSSGTAQAEHYIKIVPKETGALAPVIDVEISLNYDPAIVQQQLLDLTDKLADYYGQQPIFYVTYGTYHKYIDSPMFSEYRIWIRDVLLPPSLSKNRWLMWQYCHRGHVPGIKTYVDLNVVQAESLDELR